MYAVVETGGKQYKVQEGDVIFVEKLAVEEGSTITLDKVLAISNEGSVKVGTPVVMNANIQAKVLGHGKGEKVIIFKYKPKKDFRKKQGHRQPFTKIQIEKINA
ncbi:MAG: 50S ribosomal protein L21 [Bacillota bacterium]|nr:50S ribosomal protein L21 [Bacillota bacterium]